METASSPPRTLFSLAWRRIWDWRPLQVLETLLWIAVAVYLGFRAAGLSFSIINRFLVDLTVVALYALTPIALGILVYRVHVSVGGRVQSAEGAPPRPCQVITARLWAVGLTWLRLFAPILVLFVPALLATWLLLPEGWGRYWVGLALSHLWTDTLRTTPDVDQMSHVEKIAVCTLAFLRAVGWVTLPLTWAFWWGSRLHGRLGLFAFAHVCYALVPLLHYPLMLGLYVTAYGSFWPYVFFMGLIGPVVSAFFFLFACLAWRRRSR